MRRGKLRCAWAAVVLTDMEILTDLENLTPEGTVCAT